MGQRLARRQDAAGDPVTGRRRERTEGTDRRATGPQSGAAEDRRRAGPEKQAAALTSPLTESNSTDPGMMPRLASTAPSPSPLLYLPPARSWRPPIGEGAARWRPLIGPGHQAGRSRFEVACSATDITSTPTPGPTHWLLEVPTSHQWEATSALCDVPIGSAAACLSCNLSTEGRFRRQLLRFRFLAGA